MGGDQTRPSRPSKRVRRASSPGSTGYVDHHEGAPETTRITMAGKDYKVQKRAKEQQRLSVFQPAFRWGGNNANSSGSPSSSKIEAQKGERVDQLRRNDHRPAINDSPEAKMARDAKRMTTFQPIFGSLFSSKPSKGKSPEPPRPAHAHRAPLATGPSSQPPSRSHAADAAGHGAASGAGGPGSSRGERSGPGYQSGGLRIEPRETLGRNARTNEVASNAPGRNGRGGLAPAQQSYSAGPPSPLQRNPAFTLSDEGSRPLGISNAFGVGGRAKDKTALVSNVPANYAVSSASRQMSGGRSNGEDQSLRLAPSSGRAKTREDLSSKNPKSVGVDTERDPALRREIIGSSSQRDGIGATQHVRIDESEKRNRGASQQQSSGRPREDGKTAQHSAGRGMNVPHLIITDTSDGSSNTASGRPDRPSRGEQSIGTTASKTMPGQKLDPSRRSEEPFGVISPDSQPSSSSSSSSNDAKRTLPRSSHDPSAAGLSSKTTSDTRGVPPKGIQEDPRQAALPKQVVSQTAASKPSLSVFPKQQPQTRYAVIAAEPGTSKSKSKGPDPLLPNLGQDEVEKFSRVRYARCQDFQYTANETKSKTRETRKAAETRDTLSTPANPSLDANTNRLRYHKDPFETVKASSERHTPREESSKDTPNTSRGLIDINMPYMPDGQRQATKDTFRKSPQRDDVNPQSVKSSTNGMPASASRAAETARPVEKVKTSRNAPSARCLPDESSVLRATNSEGSRGGWASRYIETPKGHKLDAKTPKAEISPGFSREAVASAASRDRSPDRDHQGRRPTERIGDDGGAPSFKHRIQESLGGGRDSDVLKSLGSRFIGTKKPETPYYLPGQMSQPIAKDAQAQQTEAKTKYNEQSEPPASLDKPTKGWNPFVIGKASATFDPKAQVYKSKASSGAEMAPPTKSSMPMRPERPQDELFMGESGSILQPDSHFGGIAPLKADQPSTSSERRDKDKSPRKIEVPPSKVTTGRPDLAITRKPLEATRPPKPEPGPREYETAVEDISATLGNGPSTNGNSEAPAVRMVSRIIERPREIDIQKPLRPGKVTQPSTTKEEPGTDVPGDFEARHSSNLAKSKGDPLDPSPRQVADSHQLSGPSRHVDNRRDDQSRDQKRRLDNGEAGKSVAVKNEWPRPAFASTKNVETGVTAHSRVPHIDNVLTPDIKKGDVHEDEASRTPETVQKSGLLGRWTGRARQEKTSQRTDQSLASQTPLTSQTATAPGLESSFGARMLGSREGPGMDFQAGQSSQFSHPAPDHVKTPRIQDVEPLSESVSVNEAPQSSIFNRLPGRSFESSATSSPPVVSESDAIQGLNDKHTPAPLNVGGRKLAHPVEAQSKSREAPAPRFPLATEKQAAANGRLMDQATPNTDRVERSKVISPELPSQEDFFKQMRQSVMFQNAELVDKTEQPISTDATTNRKSRRNRNFSISGLQPGREVVLPDLPTFDNDVYRSAARNKDDKIYPAVSQVASDARKISIEDSQKNSVPNGTNADNFGGRPSRATSTEGQLSGSRPDAPFPGVKLDLNGTSGAPHIFPDDTKLFSARKESPPLPRLHDHASPKPIPSSVLPELKTEHTDATAVEQPRTTISYDNGPSTRSMDQPHIRDAAAEPANWATQTHATAVAQPDLQSSDRDSTSQKPLLSEATATRDLEKSLASEPPSRGAITRSPRSDTPPIKEVKKTHITESGRIALLPGPSSAEIFRRPSFDDQEKPHEPTATHIVLAPESQGDKKAQPFFDGLFRNKDNNESSLRLGNTSSDRGELSNGGRSVGVVHGTPVEKRLVSPLAAVGAGKEHQARDAEIQGHETAAAGTPPISDSTWIGKKGVHSVRSHPDTAHEPTMSGRVDTSSSPLDVLASNKSSTPEHPLQKELRKGSGDLPLHRHDARAFGSTGLENVSAYDHPDVESRIHPADELDRSSPPMISASRGVDKDRVEPMRSSTSSVQSTPTKVYDAPPPSQWTTTPTADASSKYGVAKDPIGVLETILPHTRRMESSIGSNDGEDVSALPFSRDNSVANHWQSPEQSRDLSGSLESPAAESMTSKTPGQRPVVDGNLDLSFNEMPRPGLQGTEDSHDAKQRSAQIETEHVVPPPQTTRGAHDSFTSYNGYDKQQPFIASPWIQDGQASPRPRFFNTSHEPTASGFVEDEAVSSRQSGSITGDSSAQPCIADSTHLGSYKIKGSESDSHPADFATDRVWRRDSGSRGADSSSPRTYFGLEKGHDTMIESSYKIDQHQFGNPDSGWRRSTSGSLQTSSSQKLGENSPAVTDIPAMTGDLGYEPTPLKNSIEHNLPKHEGPSSSGQSSQMSWLQGEVQEVLPSSTKVDGHSEGAAARTNPDSLSSLHREPVGVDKHASSWSQDVGTINGDLARSRTSLEARGHVQSPQQPDLILSSLRPLAGAGSANSPQDSDADLSDHILSLYDGSEHVHPENQSKGAPPAQPSCPVDGHGPWSLMGSAYTRSTRDLHSPTEDHRVSVSSVEPIASEATKPSPSPGNTHNAVGSEFAVPDSHLALDSSTQCPPQVSTTPRELSDPGDTETETMEPAPSNDGGNKDMLRKLFEKSESVGPGPDSHSQPVFASPAAAPVFSPELSRDTTIPEPEHGMPPFGDVSFDSVDIESNIIDEHRPISPALPVLNKSQLPSLSHDISDAPGLGSSDPVIFNEATVSAELENLPSRSATQEREMAPPTLLDFAGARSSTDDDPSFFQPRKSQTSLRQDWSPPEEDDTLSSLSATDPAEVDTGLKVPATVKESRFSQEASPRDQPIGFATSPEPSPGLERRQSLAHESHFSDPSLSPFTESSSIMSSSNPVQSPEHGPSGESMGEWHDPVISRDTDSHEDGVFSPEVTHSAETGGPLGTDYDEGPSSAQWSNHMTERDSSDTPSHPMITDIHSMDDASHPDSFLPEAMHDAKSPHFTPTHDGARDSLSEAPETPNESIVSPNHAVDVFDTAVSPMRPRSEATTADDHMHRSPASAAQIAETDYAQDSLTPEHDEFLGSGDRELGFDGTGPASDGDRFRLAASPMSQMHEDWAGGDNEPTQDAYENSPQTGHIGDGFSGDFVPASPLSSKESFAAHSPENDQWNDGPIQTGAYSSAASDLHHRDGDDDGATMLGGAESDVGAPAEYRRDVGDLDDPFAAEPNYNSESSFAGSAGPDMRVDGYQHSPQKFGHTGVDGSDLGDGEFENREDEFGDMGDDRFPTDDFQSGLGDFHSGIGGDDPVNDYQNDASVFDDAGDEHFSAGDFHGGPEDFDDPVIGNGPADDFPHNAGGLDKTHGYSPDADPGDDYQNYSSGFNDAADERFAVDDFQRDSGAVDNPGMSSYPADDSPDSDGEFGQSVADNYPADDFQSHSGGKFDDSGMDSAPVDSFSYDEAEPNDASFDNYGSGDYDEDNNDQLFDSTDEAPPPYEQDHGFGYPGDDAGGFSTINDDTPYGEPALSDYGGEKDMEIDPEPDYVGEDNGSFDSNQQDAAFGENHFGEDDFPGEETEFHGQEGNMNFADDGENHLDEFGGEAGWDDEMGDANLDRGLGDDGDGSGGEPSWEADGERPADFAQEEFGGEDDPFSADWEAGQPDDGSGMEEGEQFPMNEGEDFPIGGEAEDYLRGGDEEYSPPAMEGGDDFPLGGEADDYLMGGEGEYPMAPLEGGEGFPEGGDENFAVDEMYGGEDRSMEPMEGMEAFPMAEDEALPIMDGENGYTMDGEDGVPMDGEGTEDSGRDIDNFDADNHFDQGLSDHDNLVDEDHGSQSDDGSMEHRSAVEDELGSDFADEDMASDYGGPSDQDPSLDSEPEDEQGAPSEIHDEIHDREIEDDAISAADQEEEEGDDDGEEERDIDDLYAADVPSIPASPILTDPDRELASATPSTNRDGDGQDEDSIFAPPPPPQDPADLENADPVRLSCLYMQDVGLLSYPPTPTVPQEVETPAHAADEAEEPREPVRFSALYRQSLDWSQALDSTMWEDFDDAAPEEGGEQILTAPVLEAVPELARTQSFGDSGMLEVDHEQLTPVLASPLSPRPLETPPPDFDQEHHGEDGNAEAHVPFDHPEERYKGVGDNAQQRYPVSPRLQPTPPPDRDGTPASSEGRRDDQWDPRGPRTFDEMDLPRRSISPPNAGDEQDGPVQGSSSSSQMPTSGSRRSITQRFSGWWSGGGSSGQVRAYPPPLPAPYDSRYGEPSSPA